MPHCLREQRLKLCSERNFCPSNPPPDTYAERQGGFRAALFFGPLAESDWRLPANSLYVTIGVGKEIRRMTRDQANE